VAGESLLGGKLTVNSTPLVGISSVERFLETDSSWFQCCGNWFWKRSWDGFGTYATVDEKSQAGNNTYCEIHVLVDSE
jgi:hypothetical protein